MIKELNNILEIDTKLSMAYYPQTDGQIERMNQNSKQYLRMFINYKQEQWPDWLVCYETPKRKRDFYTFENLIQNLKSYNGIKI